MAATDIVLQQGYEPYLFIDNKLKEKAYCAMYVLYETVRILTLYIYRHITYKVFVALQSDL